MFKTTLILGLTLLVIISIVEGRRCSEEERRREEDRQRECRRENRDCNAAYGGECRCHTDDDKFYCSDGQGRWNEQ